MCVADETFGGQGVGRPSPRTGRALVSDDARRPDKALWHGRFEGGPAAELMAFTESLSFDRRLWPDDIAGSRRPRARPRARADHLRGRSRRRSSPRSIRSSSEMERRHVRVRRRATKTSTPRSSDASPSSPGRPGAKLHTGRSRNDQAATDVRLWMKRELHDHRPTRRRPAGVSARPGACRRRRLPARLHTSAARPAGAARPSPAGPRLGARPRCRPNPRRDRARRRLAARRRRARRLVAAARSRLHRRRARLLGDVRELARRGRLARPRRRGAVRSDDGGDRPVAHRRGVRAVDDRGVRLRPPRRRLRDRLVDAAAEEEPRHRRAGARQGRPADRQPHRVPGDDEGPAAELQPRLPGGQGAAVRLGRSGSARPSARSPG